MKRESLKLVVSNLPLGGAASNLSRLIRQLMKHTRWSDIRNAQAALLHTDALSLLSAFLCPPADRGNNRKRDVDTPVDQFADLEPLNFSFSTVFLMFCSVRISLLPCNTLPFPYGLAL